MSNKKHIDRIFQEKLKDFEVSPSPKVWQNIKGELKRTDDNKKVFPIWIRLAGIAALLFILLTIGNVIISNSNDSSTNKVVDTENVINTTNNQSDNLNNNSSVNNSQSVSEDQSLTNSEEALTNVNLLDLNSETTNDTNHNTNVAETKPSEFNTNSLNNHSVAESNTTNRKTTSENKSLYNSKVKSLKSNSKVTDVLAQKNKADASSKTTNTIAQNKTPLNSSSIKTSESNLPNESNNSGISSTLSKSESVAQNISEQVKNNANPIPELDKEKADAALGNNSKDAVVDNLSNVEELEGKEDPTIDENTDENSPSIEEEIAKAEDIIEKEEEKVDRWQVYANVAPVYYNTLGKGSHIDDQFINNSKSGEINTSYGVNVSYVLNDKLKLRSGFNSLNLSYDTDNVILYENVGNNTSSAAPRNLDLTTTGHSFSAISASNLGAQQLSSGIGANSNGAISQRIAYYEVPLELEYNLVDNKFGVNVIGGFSTFFLNDNKVYSEFDGFKTEVGEANNINNVSFSGNLGLGLDYKFSKKIKLNVQPTFKYQLNAYKNTSGNFRPYIVGVYTGLSYKF